MAITGLRTPKMLSSAVRAVSSVGVLFADYPV
jgi:hypothetical protein